MSTLNLKNRQITALLFCVKFVMQTNFAWDLWPLTGKTTAMTMFYTCYQNHRSFKNINTIWYAICRIGPSSFKQIKYTLKLINIKLTEWNFKEHYSTRNLVFWYLKQLINHFIFWFKIVDLVLFFVVVVFFVRTTIYVKDNLSLKSIKH